MSDEIDNEYIAINRKAGSITSFRFSVETLDDAVRFVKVNGSLRVANGVRCFSEYDSVEDIENELYIRGFVACLRPFHLPGWGIYTRKFG